MKAENILEELISTIENAAIDNKAEITDVKLWANSWRQELKLATEETLPIIEQFPDNEADGIVWCGKCGAIK